MEVNRSQLRQLKLTLSLLTVFLILYQFILLSRKLPFDLAYTSKTAGFFSIYSTQLLHSLTLALPLLYFLSVQVISQIVLSMLIYWTILLINETFPSWQKNQLAWGVAFWILCQLTIYLWNGHLFPYSFFAAKISAFVIPNRVYIFLLTLSTLLISSFFFMALCRLYRKRPFITSAIILIIILALLLPIFFPKSHFKSLKKPNIIIVITDSLRPDYAKPATNLRPNNELQHYISQTAFFSNSLAVLGRSTPGLVTILTGNYPKTNGARFNLIPNRFLHLENSLTHILKSAGYQTIFTADGTQFLNIDSNFGFDQIITPHVGIYDSILSLINDIPLSNLIMNTQLGSFLFPYNYGNRSTYQTYLPHTYINLIKNKLHNKNPEQPVFLVNVLAIAHWPYVWARQPNYALLTDRYENCVKELDKQFAELMSLYKKRGLLDNSIIITLSDHGDSLGLQGDRVISKPNYIGPSERLPLITEYPYLNASHRTELKGIDTATGHGTDLLSMTQLHTTLSFYYKNTIKPQVINQRVALIDIMPTILDMLNINTGLKFNGLSLKPLLLGQTGNQAFNRPIFLESEIDIPLIDVTNQQDDAFSRLINQYTNLYEINPANLKLILKDSAIPSLLTEKQRGVLDGQWLLVKYPGLNRLQTAVLESNSPDLKKCYYISPADKQGDQIKSYFCYFLSPTRPYFVLVNLESKKWQIILPEDKVPNPVFEALYIKLKEFYADEV